MATAKVNGAELYYEGELYTCVHRCRRYGRGGSLSRGMSRGYGKAAIAGAKCTDEFRSCTATGM